MLPALMRHYPQLGPWNVYDLEFSLLQELVDNITEQG